MSSKDDWAPAPLPEGAVYMRNPDDEATIARLTDERDRAREECGVWKHKAAFYEAEMYRYLEQLRLLREDSPTTGE